MARTRTILKQVRQKLLDLTRRNRLLNFRPTARTLQIVDELPDYVFERLVDDESPMILQPLPDLPEEEERNGTNDLRAELQSGREAQSNGGTHQKHLKFADRQAQPSDGAKPNRNYHLGVDIDKELPLPPTAEARPEVKHTDDRLQTDLHMRPLELRLRRMSSEARMAIEETGANLLYLAMGFLEWYEAEHSEEMCRAPLILVPVHFQRDTTRRHGFDTQCWRYKVTYDGEDILPNLSLAQKLKHDFGLVLPDFTEDLVPEEYFEEVIAAVEPIKGWRIARELVFGFFTFSKLRMYLDLDPDNWPTKTGIAHHKLIKDLLEGKAPSEGSIFGEEYDIDGRKITEELPLVVDADSSQHSALIDVFSGKDLVIEGPPGTGKSQTITNLIAAAMNDGKSVLFVAEKMAALQVVRRNLDQVGLGYFCLELHSHKAKKRILHDDIKKRLARRFSRPKSVENEISVHNRSKSRLLKYLALINTKVGPGGETIGEVFWKVASLRTKLDDPMRLSVSDPVTLTSQDISNRIDLLRDVNRYLDGTVTPCDNPWYGYRPIQLISGDEPLVSQYLSQLRDHAAKISECFQGFEEECGLAIKPTIGTLESLVTADESAMRNIPEDLAEDMTESLRRQSTQKCIEKLTGLLEDYASSWSCAVRVFRDPSSVASDTLDRIEALLSQLDKLGVTECEFNALPGHVEKINTSLDSVRHLREQTGLFDVLELPTPQTVADFQILLQISLALKNTPPGVEVCMWAGHVTSQAREAVAEAHAVHKELSIQRQMLEATFVMQNIPHRQVLTSLRDSIREKGGRLFSFLSSHYRTAHRQLRGFLTEPTDAKRPEVVVRLDTLDKYLEESESFSEHDHFNKVLGPLFKGVETNWKSLKQMVDWAQEPRRLSTGTLRKALACNNSLRKRREELNSTFAVNDAPGKQTLASLRNTMREKQGRFFSFLSAEYRETQRRLRTFLRTPADATRLAIVDNLQTLEEYLEDNHAFENHDEYKTILGPLFQGTHTDWEHLTQVADWVNEIRRLVPQTSQKNSKNAINRLITTAPGLSARLPDPEAFDLVIEHTKEHLDSLFEAMPQLVGRKGKQSLLTIEDMIKKLSHLSEWLQGEVEHATPFLLSTEIQLDEIRKAAELLSVANDIRTRISKDTRYSKLLGFRFKGINTNLQPVHATIHWIEQLGACGLPDHVLQWLLKQDAIARTDTLLRRVDEWRNIYCSISKDLGKLADYGTLDYVAFFGSELKETCFEQVSTRCKACLADIHGLMRWSDYCRTVEHAPEYELSELIEAIESGSLASSVAEDTYLHAVYSTLGQKLMREHRLLATFTQVSHERARTTFAESDRKIIDLNRRLIAAHVAKLRSPPQGVCTGPVSGFTELGLINHELSKSRRHVPIRKLIDRAGNALQALKPCFMMSPMSVAQFLAPGTLTFDLVVMDEASQIRPEEALGAIARAKQLVVVGDPNQLPPTTFFDRIGGSDDDEEESTLDDTESILDICSRVFRPMRRLRWHYRSEHESLIAFSNHEFYDDDLVVFPSAHGNQNNLGVKYHYIEGATYSRGKNLVEAERIAQAIVDHAQSTPALTLGVGTFNISQRDLIEDCLASLLKENALAASCVEGMEEGDEPLFIKNLENLQGDERDVIFISCTYGPDKNTNRVFQRFGPINLQHGWRRLNVLITRAKKRVEVFSSMRGSDVILTEKSSRGVSALKAYLEYAESGRHPDFGKITGREPDSDFEIAVANVLKQFGYKVQPQVGVAGFFVDIGVLHPNRDGEYILGIECDGATYHSARSVRDRDRLREEVLKRRGWQIYRIWSTDWFKNRETEIARLRKTLQQLQCS